MSKEPSVQFGEADGTLSQRAMRFRAACKGAGIHAEVVSDIRAAQWKKFVGLTTNAALTCVVRKPAGVVYHDADILPLARAGFAEATAVAAKDVRAVLASLESAVHASISKKGAGSFTLPGLLKISAINVPAKPKRKGINPFTKEEQWFAAKPASVKVKVRPLKKLKDAAA
jgi:hypothetical protein